VRALNGLDIRFQPKDSLFQCVDPDLLLRAGLSLNARSPCERLPKPNSSQTAERPSVFAFVISITSPSIAD
jgi:hypothetical protein